MSKKKNKNEKNDEGKLGKLSLGIKEETKHGIYALISFVLALFFVLGAFHGAGRAGIFFYTLFHFLFGWGYALVPILFLLLGISFVRSIRPNVGWAHTISSLLFLFASLGLIDLSSGARHGGGYMGRIAAFPFIKLFDVYIGAVFLTAILLISLFILFDTRPALMPFLGKLISLFRSNKKVAVEGMEAAPAEEYKEEPEAPTSSAGVPTHEGTGKKTKAVEEEFPMGPAHHHSGTYVPPPLSLLEEDNGKPNVGDIKANANVIKRTLANFGIEVEMDEITIGPTVTRYALKPAEGVKLSRIVGLQNDLGLALAAHPLRIEAPIPGKSLVGIEVPNKTKATVGLASLLSDERFQKAPKPLTIALGRAISGRPQFANLAKMPHALIAGTTGSGKSVTIHAIITSLLYRNSPEDLRLIMVDPKRVELTLYNKIPHLLTPVITDPKKAILALKWAATEMSRRYDILEAEQVRDIESYHQTIWGGPKKNKKGAEDVAQAERMPYIVIIIDELADIMSSYPRELESGIVRLAQMSRAVGIHLILSTQRPEVNVITGLIKANVPARIALKVASQIDSRTILDAGGAEKLLGAGDMLYSSGEAQPERLQSAFISEGEVKKVVKYLADSFKDDTGGDEIAFTGTITADKSIFESTLDGNDEDDDLYEEARNVVIESQKASTSFLQRKLGIGYSRAARLIDILEERGVIGPGSGSKPRDILEKTVEAERAEFPTE